MKLRNLYLLLLLINSSFGFIHNIPVKTISNKNNYLSLNCVNNNNYNNTNKIKNDNYYIYLSVSDCIEIFKFLLFINYFSQ